MPRYANSGEAVLAWYETYTQGSSTFDLCRPCGKRHDGQPLPESLKPYQAHEPRGELWEMDSPLWEDYDFEGYRCNLCDVALTPRNYFMPTDARPSHFTGRFSVKDSYDHGHQ